MGLYLVETKNGGRRVVAYSDGDAVLRVQSKYGVVATGVVCLNKHRIGAREALANADTTPEDCVWDGSVPACCDEGCSVEPDGRCEHDCPSVLLAMGMI